MPTRNRTAGNHHLAGNGPISAPLNYGPISLDARSAMMCLKWPMHFMKTGNAAHPAAHIPSADLVWWRAELRTRQEAVRTASRPIKLVEAFGGSRCAGSRLLLL
jgi:hypothetical protein